MAWLFLGCAIIGGTIIVCQFLLTLVGFSGLEGHVDLADDFPDDVPADGGSDFDPGSAGHDSTWLFNVISIRTLTAALAFFGLGGYAMNSAQAEIPAQLVVAVVAGTGALFAVHWLFRQLNRLSADGTEQIGRAIGELGVVYLTIPPRGEGQGKVQFDLQGRLVEYAAVTNSLDPLVTGSKIRVIAVTGNVLEVEPAKRPSKVEVA